MEIMHLGISSFKIKFKMGTVLVADPYDPKDAGMPFAKEKADLVTVSCNKKSHNFVEGITGPVKREELFVVEEEGEYEVGGVEIMALKSDEENLMMVIRENGITVCHLGVLSEMLSEKQIERVGPIDVLLMPVAGEDTISFKNVENLISDMSPSIVIPMSYGSKKVELEKFLDASSLEVMSNGVPKLKVDGGSLPENTKIVVLGQTNDKS
jgi:L-ascorbate metabolism protein UlaG (beta-lactamase superfamily)